MAKFSNRAIAIAFLFGNLTLLINAAGTQFITGVCTSDADCADSCCGFNSGKCAGPVIAQERDGGCGFGDAVPNDTAAVALGFTGSVGTGASSSAVAASPAATSSVAVAAGTQFITGACTKDADCADSCCGFNSGKCAGPVIAQERDGGCGFGDAAPNDIAAVALGYTGAVGTGASTTTTSAVVSAAVAPGTQFITGACTADTDCASACCGFDSGLCAGPIIAQTRDGGCGFGSGTPNDVAAVALGFTGAVGTGSAAAAATTLATSIIASATTTATSSTSTGTQFITGVCASDADCADGCCGFNSGKCAGPVIAQERDGGCGHGDATPNANAVAALAARYVFEGVM